METHPWVSMSLHLLASDSTCFYSSNHFLCDIFLFNDKQNGNICLFCPSLGLPLSLHSANILSACHVPGIQTGSEGSKCPFQSSFSVVCNDKNTCGQVIIIQRSMKAEEETVKPFVPWGKCWGYKAVLDSTSPSKMAQDGCFYF
jgi:hypothetical protein